MSRAPAAGREAAGHEGRWLGFWGKLPSRGDFVRWGLPRDFLAPWDAWLGAAVAHARRRLGEAWDAVWDAASPRRFLLAPGVCGPCRVAGVWLPSRDRVRRSYPLTLAAGIGTPRDGVGPFLRRAEEAGRAAVRDGLDPAGLAARLLAPDSFEGPGEAGEPDEEPPSWPARGSVWRRGGAWVACAGLPWGGAFASLLLGGEAP